MAGEPEYLPFCFLPKHQGTPPHTHTPLPSQRLPVLLRSLWHPLLSSLPPDLLNWEVPL